VVIILNLFVEFMADFGITSQVHDFKMSAVYKGAVAVLSPLLLV